MRAHTAFVTVVLALPPLRLSAQIRPQVDSGQRVRLSYDCGTPSGGAGAAHCRRVTGTVLRTTGDTIALDVAGATRLYRLSGDTRLELSRGRTSHWVRGAGIGFLAGSAVVLLALNTTSTSSSTNICDKQHNQDAVGWGACLGIAALAGGVPGGLIGGVAGALFRTDRWEFVASVPF